MCIVIDTNTFASVFDKSSKHHDEFKPVLDWIVYGKGKIVYGGKKYKQELRQARKYLSLFLELDKAKKIVTVGDDRVDEQQRDVQAVVEHRDFDDPHLIAIIIVSGCRLICSSDSRAYPFFKDGKLYPKHAQRPKIYSGHSSNIDLLCDENIVAVCKPPVTLSPGRADMLLKRK